MRITRGKQARQLPTRGALNDLGRTQRTIIDYAKTTPISPLQAQPSLVHPLRNPRRRDAGR